MTKKSTRRSSHRSRRRTQKAGALVLSSEDKLRKKAEIAAMKALMKRLDSARGSSEKKQIANEIAKLVLHLQIQPYDTQWRQSTIVVFQEFLNSRMGNDPEYAENLIAAIEYLQRYE
jgi:hypothetical protein